MNSFDRSALPKVSYIYMLQTQGLLHDTYLYINQFYAGIGGKDKADYQTEIRAGIVGPGMAFKGTACEAMCNAVS